MPATTLGLASPTFIIKKGNKFYVTTGVLEYDEAAAKGNLTLEEGWNEIERAFEAVRPNFLEAAEVNGNQLSSGAQTQPRALVLVEAAQTRPKFP